MNIFSIDSQGLKTPVAIESFTFSGGEEQVKLSVAAFNNCEKIEIFHRLTSSSDIIKIILAIDAIRRLGYDDTKIELIIPYFPYARQDRVCVAGEAFGAAVMAQLINNLNCNKVTVWDAHSEVTPALVNKVVNIDQVYFLQQCPQLIQKLTNGELTLLSPDAGASKKSEKIAEYFNGSVELIQALKNRDLATGRIISSKILGEVAGKDILITDDICDGGRTFIELALQLQTSGAKSVSLFVTHGIFSKGFAVFNGLIDTIYTTNSFKSAIQYEQLLAAEKEKNIINTTLNIIEI